MTIITPLDVVTDQSTVSTSSVVLLNSGEMQCFGSIYSHAVSYNAFQYFIRNGSRRGEREVLCLMNVS